jgi:hypothetical protein
MKNQLIAADGCSEVAKIVVLFAGQDRRGGGCQALVVALTMP